MQITTTKGRDCIRMIYLLLFVRCYLCIWARKNLFLENQKKEQKQTDTCFVCALSIAAWMMRLNGSNVINYIYMHLPWVMIGSAGTPGTVNRQRSCMCFTAGWLWLISADLNPKGELLFDLYMCFIRLLALLWMNKGDNYVRCNSWQQNGQP